MFSDKRKCHDPYKMIPSTHGMPSIDCVNASKQLSNKYLIKAKKYHAHRTASTTIGFTYVYLRISLKCIQCASM